MRHLFITLILFMAISLKSKGQNVHEYNRVIFTADKELHLSNIVGTRFSPTASEIDSADSYLSKYLAEKYPHDQNLLPYESYYKQYAGYRKGGQKIIYVNASCRKPDHFYERMDYPKGGGKCYFRTEVNLLDKQVLQFYFNAPK